MDYEANVSTGGKYGCRFSLVNDDKLTSRGDIMDTHNNLSLLLRSPIRPLSSWTFNAHPSWPSIKSEHCRLVLSHIRLVNGFPTAYPLNACSREKYNLLRCGVSYSNSLSVSSKSRSLGVCFRGASTLFLISASVPSVGDSFLLLLFRARPSIGV